MHTVFPAGGFPAGMGRLASPAVGKGTKKASAEVVDLDATTVRALAGTLGSKVKKKCCRSAPRCKGCPVVAMRTARLTESGLSGKDLKKAIKRARAA